MLERHFGCGRNLAITLGAFPNAFVLNSAGPREAADIQIRPFSRLAQIRQKFRHMRTCSITVGSGKLISRA